MSAFVDLLQEAEKLGVYKATWEWHQEAKGSMEEWSCVLTPHRHEWAHGSGRTGEEALREALKAMGKM